MQYVPATLDVAVGDSVVWTNDDIVPHTVTAPGVFDSGSLSSKQGWRFVIMQAGEIDYGCSFHPTMKARLSAR